MYDFIDRRGLFEPFVDLLNSVLTIAYNNGDNDVTNMR